jgi:hypothetical protein
LRPALERFDLGVERISQACVVVVEKTEILATARRQSNVPRSGYALVVLDPNVVDTGKSPAHLGRFIRGSIINYDHLNVTA